MADKKITQLVALTSPAKEDLLLIVDDPAGSPISKKVSLGDIFGETAQTVFSTINISANTSTGTATIGGDVVRVTPTTRFEVVGLADFNNDEIRIRTKQTPPNGNNLAQGWPVGTIAWDDNFIYIAANSTNLVRASLSAF
jgi:hypothetical protein